MDDSQLSVTWLNAYTEATHTANGNVSGAEAIKAGDRYFTPERVVAKYHWRTQLGETGWAVGNLEVSGPWCPAGPGEPLRTGTACVLLGETTAPGWLLKFAWANRPTLSLVFAEEGT